jgi:glycosyltransferase involved in cell wall biosynthesis
MPDTGTILDYVADRAAGPSFKPGRASDHETGIFYFAPWESVADGFAEHARRSVRALAMTGEPILLRNFYQRGGDTTDPEFAAIEKELGPLLQASISRPTVEIHQLVPSEEALHRQTGFGHWFLRPAELARINRFRILYTVWERDRISRGALQALNRAGQVWVACEMNRRMLERAGVDAARLRVVPVPFFADDPHLALRQARRPGPVRFYHIGKWEPRKAQDQIILAFLRAFRPGQAELFLRVNALVTQVVDFPQTPTVVVHQALGHGSVRANGWTIHNVNLGVKWIAARLPAARLVDLHAVGDVYVTLSRGEGWDLPAYAAKLAGNLLVYTPSGGPQDFAGPADVRVEPSGTMPCHPFYRWNTDACYLDFELDAAVVGLQEAARRVATHDRASPDRDLSMFAAPAVGERMRRCISELLEIERQAAP